ESWVGESSFEKLGFALGDTLLLKGPKPALRHDSLDLVDDGVGVLTCKQETRALREEIPRVGPSTFITADHGEVPAIDAYGDSRRQIKGRRELPALLLGNHGMIAWMVVNVRDEGIERNAPKKLMRCALRVVGHTAQLFCQENI